MIQWPVWSTASVHSYDSMKHSAQEIAWNGQREYPSRERCFSLPLPEFQVLFLTPFVSPEEVTSELGIPSIQIPAYGFVPAAQEHLQEQNSFRASSHVGTWKDLLICMVDLFMVQCHAPTSSSVTMVTAIALILLANGYL